MTDFLYIDTKQRPEALGSDAVGVGKATSSSLTDKLTPEHQLTLEEAHLILNTKKEDSPEQTMAVSARFSIPFPRSLTSSGCTSVLQTPIQTEFSQEVIHPREIGGREACPDQSIACIAFGRRLSGRGNVSRQNTNLGILHRSRHPHQSVVAISGPPR